MRATLLAIISCYCLFSSVFTASVPFPSQDPWYDEPSNISDYTPGAVIRSRSVSPQLESFLSLPVNVSVKATFQYLFRTTDSLGDAAASVVTLIEPYNSDPSKLLGYQAFYDSANVDCSPSYTMRDDNENMGLPVSGLNVSQDIPFVSRPLIACLLSKL